MRFDRNAERAERIFQERQMTRLVVVLQVLSYRGQVIAKFVEVQRAEA